MIQPKVALGLVFISVFCPLLSARAVKPRPPLQLALSSTEIPGGNTEITLRAKANTATEGIVLSVELPLGLIRVEGDTEWEGPIHLGEAQSLVVIVRNEGMQPYTIIGRAQVRLPGDGRFLQESALVLNPSGAAPPSPAPPVRHGSGEDARLEFREN